MPSYRELPSGKFQATVRLPDQTRRSRVFACRSDAERWGREAEASGVVTQSHLSLTWTSGGLRIDIPDDLLTMDTAAQIEQTLIGILGKE
jgi:hypothetical protein